MQLPRNQVLYLYGAHGKADKFKLCLSRAEIQFKVDFKGKGRMYEYFFI